MMMKGGNGDYYYYLLLFIVVISCVYIITATIHRHSLWSVVVVPAKLAFAQGS